MSKAIKAVRVNLIFSPFSLFISLASSLLVVRILGPSIFSQYAISMALMGWIILICEGGCNAGIGHYLKQALEKEVLKSFFWTLQLRRWAFVVSIVCILLIANAKGFPLSLIKNMGISSENILLVGILGALTLHSQLINVLMLGTFMHKRQIILAQAITILRGFLLIATIQVTTQISYLIMALIVVEMANIAISTYCLRTYFIGQNLIISESFINKAHQYGLVGLYDKLVTALSGGQFMLLVLAASYSKIELGILAVVMDSLQKFLSIAGLPISNLVTPLLNDSRNDCEKFSALIGLMGKCVLIWFSFIAGALICAIPYLFVLLYGNQYRAGIPIALIWVIPLFLESGIRGVWGAAILISNQYKWMMYSNTVAGVVFVAALFLLRGFPLDLVVGILGGMRAIYSICVYSHAKKVALNKDSHAIGSYVLIATMLSIFVSILLIQILDFTSDVINLFSIVTIYTASFITITRLFSVVTGELRESIYKVFGKYNWFINILVGKNSN
jgi:O-antigen/teichoic acid export membrane protein